MVSQSIVLQSSDVVFAYVSSISGLNTVCLLLFLGKQVRLSWRLISSLVLLKY